MVTSCKKKSVDDPVVPYPGDLMPLPYTETFEHNFGTYTVHNVLGDQEWEIDYKTAKMAGSIQDSAGTYINYANEDWLISSPIIIQNVDHAKIVMTYIGCYFDNINDDVHMLASKDYSGSNIRSAATWKDLNANLIGSSGWSSWNKIELSLDEYIGDTMYVAIRYTSNTSDAGTIEIKSISVEEGEPNDDPTPGGDVQTLPYVQDFDTEFGTYITKDVLGEQSWMIDFSSAKMAGSVKENGVYVNYDNEDWLISSPVKITDVEHAMMTMTYIGCYFNDINNDISIMSSTDYQFGEMPETATWSEVSKTLVGSSNWNTWNTAEISLDELIGQTVTIAVKYVSTTAKAGTIEIKSITVEEGEAGGGGHGGDVQYMPYVQDFSTEFGTYMTQSVIGDQAWMIDFSSAKMAGSVKENGVYVNYDNEDWLISSPVKITDVEHAMMTMTYIGCYFNDINNDISIMSSTDYQFGEMPETATWSEVSKTLVGSSNWNTWNTAEISLDELIGQTVTIAVKYVSTTAKAGTIEIKSITVEEGEAGGVTPTPPTPGPGGEVQNMPYAQSFATEFGSYTTYDVAGSESWMIDFSTAKMTGYVGGTNYANEDWLISSPVSITGVSDAKMTMVYIGRYFNNINDDITIWASTNYSWNSNPTTASWNQIPATLVENNNWNDFKTAEISLTEYVGQTVTLAVKYLSNDVKAGTIEIQSITIEEGSGVTPTPPTPGPGTGSGTVDDPYNVASGISLQGQNIIGWVQGYIVGVVKNGTSTVTSNADVNWSAPFDSYTNVVIADDANCTEIANCVIVNLPSGKPLREQVNLFDNPDNWGKLLAVNGTLRTYFGQAGLRDSGGTENDFVLEGGVTPPPTPPTPGGDIFSETFASGQGDFTIQDVNLPEGLTYVWQYASNYSCMKASAYVGQAYETESWLVSPAIDLSNVSTATLTFEQAVNYASPNGALFMMISTDYNGDVTTATWTELNLSAWPAGSNWSFVSSTADLSQYAGQNVTIAFKYTSSTSASATWEVKNFVVTE